MKSFKVDVRSRFLEYFVQNNHQLARSSSLVPQNDPSMLFTIAGMVPFKSRFISETEDKTQPASVVSCQRCFRANDLDIVGKSSYHLTLFEMLGNFSFGSSGGYFKEEAIVHAHTFLTKELGLSGEDLIVSHLQGDVETRDLWERVLGRSQGRIVAKDETENFWKMGDKEDHPCGPCSEIFVERKDGSLLELWNLVFMQEKRNGTKLAFRSVDTGMGLERISSVMEGVDSAFETERFRAVGEAVAEVLKQSRERESCRVIADHTRAAVMLAADGVVPGNTGRGHVLRRIIRRATRKVSTLRGGDIGSQQFAGLRRGTKTSVYGVVGGDSGGRDGWRRGIQRGTHQSSAGRRRGGLLEAAAQRRALSAQETGLFGSRPVFGRCSRL